MCVDECLVFVSYLPGRFHTHPVRIFFFFPRNSSDRGEGGGGRGGKASSVVKSWMKSRMTDCGSERAANIS